MANCLSHINLDCMVGKKCKEFLGQVEDFKDAIGYNLFLFLFLGLFYFSILGHSPYCHSS